MKRNSLFIIIVAVTLVVIAFYSLDTGGSDYEARIKADRNQKGEFMRSSPDSPFAGRANEFAGLKYFEPDTKFKVEARFTPILAQQSVQLAASDGLAIPYLTYGYADFELEGKKQRLTIFEVTGNDANKGTLFIPFGDETSARTTYGAGRYLDVQPNPSTHTVILDFNNAYNPYCAYDNTYTCPLPPRENLLDVAIPAGEKKYHD